MFVTHGPVDPESSLFVGRGDEIKRIEAWLTTAHCVGAVLGARQTGKTSLLLRLRHILQNKYAMAYIDLQAVEGCDIDHCCRFISEELTGQLGATIEAAADARGFRTFLQRLAVTSKAVRIAVLLDEVAALPVRTAMKLASTIRAVFTNRVIRREYGKYVFLLAGASDMLELTTGRNSPLQNVTESIYLEDLSQTQAEELLREGLARAGIQAQREMMHELYEWTSGHPYWHQLLGEALVGSSGCLPADRDVRPIVEQLVRTEDRNLPHIFKSLGSDKGLWSLTESVLDGVPIDFSRANAAVAKLELIGIVKNEEGRCRIRNRIYEKAMHELPVKRPRIPAVQSRAMTQLINSAANLQSLLNSVAVFLQQVYQNHLTAIFTKSRKTFCCSAVAGSGVLNKVLREIVIVDVFDTPMHGAVEPSKAAIPEALKEHFLKCGAELVSPLCLRGELWGFLSLSRKLSDDLYDAQDLEFLNVASEQIASGVERINLRKLESDAQDARAIQVKLLPKVIPQIPGFQIDGSWRSSQLVGGDYFDVLKVNQNTFAVCIADVSGKGMPAALLMANLQMAVRSQASAEQSPKLVCEAINGLIASNIEPGRFITFFYGLVRADERSIVYVNAGHNYPILLRSNDELVRLDVGGIVLGVATDWRYQEAEVKFFPGDQMLLFTDGLTETRNVEGMEFGEDCVVQLLRENRHLSASNMLRLITDAAANFSAGDFEDDVTALLLVAQ